MAHSLTAALASGSQGRRDDAAALAADYARRPLTFGSAFNECRSPAHFHAGSLWG